MKNVEGIACTKCDGEIVEIPPKPSITLDVSFSLRVDALARVCLSCGHVELFLNSDARNKVIKEQNKIAGLPSQVYVPCPKCGGTNNPGGKFCVFCGQRL